MVKKQHFPWYFGAIAVVISIALGMEKLEWAPWEHITEDAAAAAHGSVKKAAAEALTESEKDATRERDILMNAVITNQAAIDKLSTSIESKLDAVNNKLWNMNNPKIRTNP